MTRDNAELGADVVRALREYHGEATDLDLQLAARAGLSPSDMRCLDVIDLQGGVVAAGELARATNLTTGAITGVIDRLERAGLARRVADPADRRRVLVELDPAGRAKGRRNYAPLVAAERAYLAGLDAHELAILRDFLRAEAGWMREHATRLRAQGPRGLSARRARG